MTLGIHKYSMKNIKENNTQISDINISYIIKQINVKEFSKITRVKSHNHLKHIFYVIADVD